jgi:hypothetical protein
MIVCGLVRRLKEIDPGDVNLQSLMEDGSLSVPTYTPSTSQPAR